MKLQALHAMTKSYLPLECILDPTSREKITREGATTISHQKNRLATTGVFGGIKLDAIVMYDDFGNFPKITGA